MISINPYEIILQIVNFGILFFLLKKFLIFPMQWLLVMVSIGNIDLVAL